MPDHVSPAIEPTQAEIRWMARLKKLIEQQPPNTWVMLIPSSALCLVRYGADGQRVLGSAGHDYVVESIVPSREWDGGDF